MAMTNNDILVRIRYAFDIKETDMVEIFKLGGIELTREDLRKLLQKSTDEEAEDVIKCNDKVLDSFLNGFITFKRGQQEQKPGQADKQEAAVKTKESVNNLLLKKLKIALALTTEDIIDILAEVGVIITKGELGALLRKVGHKNYKECGDKYARNFLKGLAVRYRG